MNINIPTKKNSSVKYLSGKKILNINAIIKTGIKPRKRS